MKLGIVGSRQRCSKEDWELLFKRVVELKPSMIISGGCAVGADNFAEEFARKLGIPITIFYPRLGEKRWVLSQQEIVKLMYARNKQIAWESDYLIALVAPNRRGGTENTIKHFKERRFNWRSLLEIL